MDFNIRQLQRSENKAPWLRALIRSGRLSESMKKMLCALGYEPMVLVLDLPGKTSSAQKSFMKPHTFCNYKEGRWLLGIDYMRVAKYMSKKYWSRIMCQDVLEKLTVDYKVFKRLDELGIPINVRQEGDHFELVDGQHRLAAFRNRNYKMPFYTILAQQIRNEEVRHALIKALVARLA